MKPKNRKSRIINRKNACQATMPRVCNFFCSNLFARMTQSKISNFFIKLQSKSDVVEPTVSNSHSDISVDVSNKRKIDSLSLNETLDNPPKRKNTPQTNNASEKSRKIRPEKTAEEMLKIIMPKCITEEKTGCIVFIDNTRKKNKAGKHCFKWPKNFSNTVDRIVYVAKTGHNIDGLRLHHKCRNKNCVNIDHIDVPGVHKKIEESEKEGLEEKARQTLNALSAENPDCQYKLHKSGLYVLRKYPSRWRRVCKHSVSPSNCSKCFYTLKTDKTFRKRQSAIKKEGPLPKTTACLVPYRDCTEAPILPLSQEKKSLYKRRFDRFRLQEIRLVDNPNFDEPCWLSKGRHDNSKRSYMSLQNGKAFLSHRFTWSAANERHIPKNFEIRHKCKTKGCCQPAHLEIGTHGQNMLEDRERDGTLPYGENHPMSKHKDDLVRAIAQSKHTGTRMERALRYNVTPNFVKKVDAGSIGSRITGNYEGSNRAKKKRFLNPRKKTDWKREDYERSLENLRRREVVNKESQYNGTFCTESTYFKNLDGYHIMSVKCKSIKTHIFSWEFHKNDCKPTPPKKQIMHLCNNPSCHNHLHLKLGDNSENQRYRHESRRKRDAKNKGSEI